VKKVELIRAQTSSNPMLKWTLHVLGPQHQGRLPWRNNVVASSDNMKWLKTHQGLPSSPRNDRGASPTSSTSSRAIAVLSCPSSNPMPGRKRESVMARPAKPIDSKLVEDLARMQCNEAEIRASLRFSREGCRTAAALLQLHLGIKAETRLQPPVQMLSTDLGRSE